MSRSNDSSATYAAVCGLIAASRDAGWWGQPPCTHFSTRRTSRSLASGSAIGDPRALADERSDHDADLVGRGRELGGPLAEVEPHEVALRLRHRPTGVGQPGDHPVALGDQRVDPLEQLRLALERRERRGLRDAGDAEGQGDRPQRAGQRRRPDGVPDAEPGQPVGLGEGPGEQHVVVAAVGRDSVDGVGHPHELDVRLVDDHQHLRRDLGEEGVELGLRDGRPRGVVGRADQDDAGAVGDGVGHRVEVVAAVGGDGHADHPRRRRRDRDGVGLEAAPREHDLVVGVAERLHQLVDQRHRAGGQGQVLGGYAQLGRQRVVERDVAHVGVAVHGLHGRRRGLDHAGQRWVGVLVGRQLVRRQVRARRRRLARDVRRDLGDRGTRLRGRHAPQASYHRWLRRARQRPSRNPDARLVS